ncbi:MAG: sugar ABC transporter permease [Clostridiales bacterium]|jgi:ABC-type sugar transport system permease subunit|nr:sugar ABC transporter permease [Clostridiales bacterium]
MKLQTRKSVKALSCVIPATAYYLLFTLVPLVMLFWYSFTNYNVLERTQAFTGFENYVKIFTNAQYYSSLLTTLIIAVLIMAFGMSFGFLLALGLNRIARGRSVLRILWYIPALLPMAVMSQFISILLQPLGIANNIARALGGNPIAWYDSVFWMYFYIVLLITWKGLGSTAVLFMAGLAGISTEIYEAAAIDGATGAKRMLYITLPLMRPMIGFILITGFLGAFNVFEPVQLISGGAPRGKTEVILYKIYTQGFDNFKLGFASAISVVVFVIVLLLTVLNMRITDSNILKSEVAAQ